MAERYKPTGRVDSRSFGVFVAVVATAAVAAAAMAHAAEQSLSLVLVMPAVQGLAVGGAGIWVIRRQRLQRPATFGALTACAAALSLAAHAWADYRIESERHAAHCTELRDVQMNIGVGSERELRDAHDQCLQRFTPRAFLVGRFELESGPDTGEPRSGVAVGLLEFAVAMGIAGALAAKVAREPACPKCGKWRVEQALGRAALGAADQLVQRLLDSDTDGAIALLEPPDTREEVVLALLACPDGHDGGGGVLRIRERRIDRRRTLVQREVADLVVSRPEAGALREQLRGEEPV